MLNDKIPYIKICPCGKEWWGYPKNGKIPKRIQQEMNAHEKYCLHREEQND